LPPLKPPGRRWPLRTQRKYPPQTAFCLFPRHKSSPGASLFATFLFPDVGSPFSPLFFFLWLYLLVSPEGRLQCLPTSRMDGSSIYPFLKFFTENSNIVLPLHNLLSPGRGLSHRMCPAFAIFPPVPFPLSPAAAFRLLNNTPGSLPRPKTSPPDNLSARLIPPPLPLTRQVRFGPFQAGSAIHLFFPIHRVHLCKGIFPPLRLAREYRCVRTTLPPLTLTFTFLSF